MSALRQLDTDIWVADRPQKFWGLEVGTRMTVMRLTDRALLLHAAVALDDELRRALDALGDVRYVVAPNRFHHLYAGDAVRAYPGAKLWIAPGLRDKRPDLVAEGVLDDDSVALPWSADVDRVFFRGRPMENEVTFFHRASRTLVMSDLAFNFGPRAPWLTRTLTKVIGGYGELRPSRLDRFIVRDYAAARPCMEAMLGWDFDRIVIAHGEILERGGKETLRRGYHWLLDG